ncbi:flagellin [Sporosarcina thermotolerans]|uniref:Flagellin n=1 Tax=Sporosarcina thermotolerans TaxID=633404 RepID=A0AAW9A6K0_9BACL|nr:flagellin [Sporosarcina thermotolerans]MDW0116952.1 flagellin [Sporosarcina thermotolerans]WHT47931.1 flagellin [Sporosarcina thermotolerans]
MILKSNIPAINTLNRMKINNNKVMAGTEKLSSGLKINRAGDDAAGLAISEKMRAQIRGLEKAQQNIQDGISLIQVADSGMAEIQSMLQRIRELSVKSSSDTLTNEDRDPIQNEVTELVKGIDTIANNTEYNGLVLLTGENAKEGSSATSDSLAQYVHQITDTNGINDKYSFKGTNYASAIIDFSNIKSASEVSNLVGKGVHYTCATCTKAYSIKFVNGNPDTSRLNDFNPVMEVDVSAVIYGVDLVGSIIENAYGQSGFQYDPITKNIPSSATGFVDHYSQLAVNGGKIYIYDNRPGHAEEKWPAADGRGVFNHSVYGETEVAKGKFLYVDIQAGSNTGQSMRLEIPNVTSQELGIENLLVNYRDSAISAITQIDNAISKVSSARVTVGGYQNRLEHAFNNISCCKLNLSDAESRIRDADMASEIMKLSKDRVILQASQAMMVQANQITQGILQLLK